MKFLLVGGYIKFPNFVSKDGIGFIEKPTNEKILEKLELTEVEQPSQKILDAVEGIYFERYSEAQDYLNAILNNVEQ